MFNLKKISLNLIITATLLLGGFLLTPVLAQSEDGGFDIDSSAVLAATSSGNVVSASSSDDVKPSTETDSLSAANETAQARITKIIDSKDLVRDNGDKVKQQNLEFYILSGPLKDQMGNYNGISDLDVVGSNVYKIGDKVIVSYSRGGDGRYIFYIIDYIRNSSLLWLTIIFVLVIFVIGGLKGLRALASLALSFFVIMKVLVPLILKGYDPLAMGLLMSFVILLFIIYVTEGWNRKSHLAVLSIALSLVATAVLAIIFSGLTRLTGTSQEETTFLLDATKQIINFKGLLLASFVIGTLGVLDDVAVGQIEAVNQIKKANPKLTTWQVFKMASEVGKSHLGAIINTLFLAYVSASFPLILLFSLNNPPFLSFSDVINNEEVATEIVRTLVGIIGLCLSVPIATWLGAKWLKVK